MGRKVFCRRYISNAVPVLVEFGIRDARTMTEGKPVMLPGDWSIIQFIGRQILSHPVPAIIREPEIAGAGIPVKSHRVSDPPGIYLEVTPVRVHAKDRGIPGISSFADVAGCTHRHIQSAVRAKGDEFPAMVLVCREIVSHNFGRGGIFQLFTDPVEPEYPAHLCNEERAVMVGHAIRAVQS